VTERRHHFGAPLQRMPRFTRQPDFVARAKRPDGHEVGASGEISVRF
jgi:hypothetical protein